MVDGLTHDSPSKPLVSVITATRDMGEFVVEAVDSVLAQDYPAVESIVIDDGSRDGTAERLARYADDPRVRVVHADARGQAAAKNHGLELARGEIVGFCDADDVWLPHKLSRQVPVFERAGRPALVYGEIERMDEHGRPLPALNDRRHRGHVAGELLRFNFIPFVTCLARRDVLLELGGFDTSMTMSIDYDLWLRVAAVHRVDYVDDVVARLRIWPGQMSTRTGEQLENAFRMTRRFVERHPHVVTSRQVRRAWCHTYTTRGLWHRAEGRSDEALADYVRAFRSWPFDARLARSVANLMLRRGS